LADPSEVLYGPQAVVIVRVTHGFWEPLAFEPPVDGVDRHSENASHLTGGEILANHLSLIVEMGRVCVKEG